MPFLEFKSSKRESCYITLSKRNFRLFLKYKADVYFFADYIYIQQVEVKPSSTPESSLVYEAVISRLQEVLPKYYCLSYRLKCWCSDVCEHEEEEIVFLTRAQYRQFKVMYKLKVEVGADGRLWKLAGIEKLYSHPHMRVVSSLEQMITEALYKSMLACKDK